MTDATDILLALEDEGLLTPTVAMHLRARLDDLRHQIARMRRRLATARK